MNGLNMQSLGKLLLLKPPLAEQDAILNYVSSASLPLVIAIGRIRREIELLREYRNRLVADVVTGALEIGGVVARLADGSTSNRAGDPADETDEAELADEEAET